MYFIDFIRLKMWSVVAQWLAQLPLVPEVQGSIPACGEKNSVPEHAFSSVICRDDTR